MSESVTRCFLVFGKVQGVYFRQSARVEAERLKVAGRAQNLPDGSVRVIVQGEASAVESLRQWLHRGPPRARVDRVQEYQPVAGDAPLEASGGTFTVA